MNETVSLCEFELAILMNLMYPGKGRHLMPPNPLTPYSVRCAKKCEMRPFAGNE